MFRWCAENSLELFPDQQIQFFFTFLKNDTILPSLLFFPLRFDGGDEPNFWNSSDILAFFRSSLSNCSANFLLDCENGNERTAVRYITQPRETRLTPAPSWACAQCGWWYCCGAWRVTPCVSLCVAQASAPSVGTVWATRGPSEIRRSCASACL